MLFRCIASEGRWPRGRYALGALVGVVLASSVSAGTAYAAFEVDPAAIGHTDPTYTLAHPNWGDSATQSVTSFDGEASQVQSKVDETATETGDSGVAKLVRDCAKEGLASLVAELASAIANNQSLDLMQAAEHSILSCLETYTTPSQINAQEAAATLAADIAQGASEALGVNEDVNGLADWFQVVDYYYVEY